MVTGRRALQTLAVVAFLTAAAVVIALAVPSGTSAGDGKGGMVRGGGTTIVEGGTGTPSLTPMITKVAFHWSNGAGHFECLAPAPSTSAGEPGSGNFDTNVMYVTGPINSADVHGNAAVLKGSATVTGAGAGSNQPFTATLTKGGPGATLVLEISGLTFKEISSKASSRSDLLS
jgi:hypothetical protein